MFTSFKLNQWLGNYPYFSSALPETEEKLDIDWERWENEKKKVVFS